MQRSTRLLICLGLTLGLFSLFTMVTQSPIAARGVREPQAPTAGIVITVTTDSDLEGTCPSPTSCSLRTAIVEANNDATTTPSLSPLQTTTPFHLVPIYLIGSPIWTDFYLG